MPVISNTLFLVTLPSGHKAVYELQPQHLNDRPGTTLNQRCLDHGKQVAHQLGHAWYHAGGWDEIIDPRACALLERAPEADLGGQSTIPVTRPSV